MVSRSPRSRCSSLQGVEMKRPSDIFVRASFDGARVHNVRVGGYCAEVMRGELTLP